MKTLRFPVFAVAFVMASTASLAAGAPDSPRRAFVRKWQGRTVVVKQRLYSLVYNERGKLGNTYHDRRDGLTVVTPFEGTYYQFDGRQSRDDVTARDPQRILDAVSTMYYGESLDVRSYRRIEPVVIAQYNVGVELIVADVRIERDVIRLAFAPASGASGDGAVTTLTIKWPVAISDAIFEQDAVDGLIAKFVALK